MPKLCTVLFNKDVIVINFSSYSISLFIIYFIINFYNILIDI